MQALRDHLAQMLSENFGPNFHPALLDAFEKIAEEAIEARTCELLENLTRERDAARSRADATLEAAARDRGQLVTMTEQRDLARSELALARHWIAQHANRRAFEAWVIQARAASGGAPTQ